MKVNIFRHKFNHFQIPKHMYKCVMYLTVKVESVKNAYLISSITKKVHKLLYDLHENMNNIYESKHI